MRTVALILLLSSLLFSCTKEKIISAKSNTAQNVSDLKNDSAGTIFIVSNYPHDLYALDALTGEMKWSFDNTVYSYLSDVSPCYKDGILYVKSAGVYGACFIEAIDPASGSLLWSANIGSPLEDGFDFSSPFISDEHILYTGVGEYLVAFDLNTKSVKWKFLGSSTFANRFSSPTVVKGSLYVADNFKVYSFNPETGEINWVHEDKNLQVYPSSPTVRDGHVVYTSHYEVVSLDIETGLRQWSYPVSPYISESVAFNNGTVYCGNPAALALNAKDGSVVWKSDTGTLRSSVFFRNDKLFVPGIESLEAYDATTGKFLWSNYTGRGQVSYASYAEACATRKVVYITGKDGVLYAYNIADGSLLWKFMVNIEIYNMDQLMVIVTKNGSVIHPTVSGMTQ